MSEIVGSLICPDRKCPHPAMPDTSEGRLLHRQKYHAGKVSSRRNLVVEIDDQGTLYCRGCQDFVNSEHVHYAGETSQ